MTPKVLRVALLASVLAILVVVLLQQIDLSQQAAACIERAEFELILCMGGPNPWSIPALLTGLILVSIVTGRELACWRG